MDAPTASSLASPRRGSIDMHPIALASPAAASASRRSSVDHGSGGGGAGGSGGQTASSPLAPLLQSPSSALHARRQRALSRGFSHARTLSIIVNEFNWRRVLALPGHQRTLGDLEQIRVWLRKLRSRFLDKLSDDTLRHLAQSVQLVQLPAGAVVFRQGEPGFATFVCLRGQVAIFRDSAAAGAGGSSGGSGGDDGDDHPHSPSGLSRANRDAVFRLSLTLPVSSLHGRRRGQVVCPLAARAGGGGGPAGGAGGRAARARARGRARRRWQTAPRQAAGVSAL